MNDKQSKEQNSNSVKAPWSHLRQKNDSKQVFCHRLFQ